MTIRGLPGGCQFLLFTTIVLLCMKTYNAFTGFNLECPSSCNCVDSQSFANCSKRNLISVPEFSYGGIISICLAYNQINSIQEDDFKLLQVYEYFALPQRSIKEELKVRNLNLKYNVITYIHENAFINLRDLTVLDLSHNKITYMPPDLFDGNSNLNTLYLQGNNLFTTGPIIISLSLTELDISYCDINWLSVDAFYGVPNIKTLNMNGNPLESLSINTVKSLTMLDTIKLEPIKSMPQCLPVNYFDVLQYFRKNFVYVTPYRICEVDGINTSSEMQESKWSHNIMYAAHIGHAMFVVLICVLAGGVVCVIFIFQCFIRRKGTPPSDTENTVPRLSRFDLSERQEMMPWYKMMLHLLLFGAPRDNTEKNDLNSVDSGNQTKTSEKQNDTSLPENRERY